MLPTGKVIDQFITENSGKWEKGNPDDINIGLLASKNGRFKIQVGEMQLDADETALFTDRILSVFKNHNQVLFNVYNRIRYLSEYSASQSDILDAWFWKNLLNHIDENLEKHRLVISINYILKTNLLNVEETERDRIKQLASGIDDEASLSIRSLQKTYGDVLHECIIKTRDEAKRAELFPREIDRLLEECSQNGRLVKSGPNDIWNPLSLAVYIGDIDTIKKAQAILGDRLPDELNQGKRLPLSRAIEICQYPYVEALIAAGANINARNDSYEPILHEIIATGNPQAIAYCLKQKGIDLNAKDEYDNTPLHKAVLAAAANPTVSFAPIIEQLLQNDTIAAQQQMKDLFGRTPLDIAIQNKADDVIRVLMGNPSFEVQKLPGYGITPQAINQTPVLGKLTQYLTLKKEQDIQNLERIKNQLSPDELAKRQREIRDPSILPSGGHCNGFSLLYQYYTFRGKEDEFFFIMNLLAQWDGKEESLRSTAEVKGLSGDYMNLEDLMEHWINDIVWFQHLNTAGISFPFSQLERNAQLEVVRKDETPAVTPSEPTLFNFSREQLVEWLQIQSHFPGNVIELAGASHNTTAKVLPESKVAYYDSNIPFRLPPFDTIDKLADVIQKIKHLSSGKSRDKISEQVLIYRMIPAGQEKDLDLPQNVPAALMERPSPNQYSKLHLAILFNDDKLFDAELASQAPQINTPNAHKITPLRDAINLGRDKMAEKLLNLPNIDLSYETHNVDLLRLAINCRQGNIAKQLIKKGIERTASQVMAAVQTDQKDILKELLAKGVTKNQINEFSFGIMECPLQTAIRKRDREMIEILLQHGADFKAESFLGMAASVLSNVADIQDQNFQDFIVPLITDINGVDDEGRNLLHYAVRKGNTSLVERLLRYPQIDPSIPDKSGKIAADLAKEMHQDHILALLQAVK